MSEWVYQHWQLTEFCKVGRHTRHKTAVMLRARHLVQQERHVQLLDFLDLIRDHAGCPMYTTNAPSGVRTVELNQACGGADSSQHLAFQAADVTFGTGQSGKLLDFFDWLAYCDYLRHLWHQIRVYEARNFCHVGVAAPGVTSSRSHYRVQFADGRVIFKSKGEL